MNTSDLHDIVRIGLVFGFVILIIAIKNYRQIQQQKMWHETARLALEKGQPVPPNLDFWNGGCGRRFGPAADLRRGLIWLAVGLALYFAIPDHRHVWGIVPAFVGIAFLISGLIGWLRSDRSTDENDPAAPDVTPADSELIGRARFSDDRAAFGELVRRYQSPVRNFLRHLTSGDSALADDLAQETFLQAYRGLPRFRGEASFNTWLFGIAHNHYRNARRRLRTAATELGRETADDTSPPLTRAADLRHDLAGALKHLSSDEQTAVHLFYQQGLTHPEISTVAGWPLGTVKTHLARGKEKLRQILAVWNPQP